MAAHLPTSSAELDRRSRSLRTRAGVAKTFGSILIVFSVLLVLPGALILHDAFTHPLTADSSQVLMGSSCLAIAMLLVIYLWRATR